MKVVPLTASVDHHPARLATFRFASREVANSGFERDSPIFSPLTPSDPVVAMAGVEMHTAVPPASGDASGPVREGSAPAVSSPWAFKGAKAAPPAGFDAESSEPGTSARILVSRASNLQMHSRVKDMPVRERWRFRIETLWWRLAVLALVLVDVTITIVEFTYSIDETPMGLEVLSLLVVLVLCVEWSFRLYAFGCCPYLRNVLPWVDFVACFASLGIAIASVADTAARSSLPADPAARGSKVTGGFMIVLRLSRWARPLRLLLYCGTSKVAMTKAARRLVSQNRRRFHDPDFDLDLTYVTDGIIAMSLPAHKAKQTLYRNNINDVARFFRERHGPDRYRIFNVTSERRYDASLFGGDDRVSIMDADDHNPAPLLTLEAVARDIHRYLLASGDDDGGGGRGEHKERDGELVDKSRVAAIHCKGGKGRTGTVICCYLLESKIFETADLARAYFAHRRTDAARGSTYQGVQTPSQARYIRYYEQMRRSPQVYHAVLSPPVYRVDRVRIHHVSLPAEIVAKCAKAGGPPYFRLEIYDGERVCQGKKRKKKKKKATIKGLRVPSLRVKSWKEQGGGAGAGSGRFGGGGGSGRARREKQGGEEKGDGDDTSVRVNIGKEKGEGGEGKGEEGEDVMDDVDDDEDDDGGGEEEENDGGDGDDEPTANLPIAVLECRERGGRPSAPIYDFVFPKGMVVERRNPAAGTGAGAGDDASCDYEQRDTACYIRGDTKFKLYCEWNLPGKKYDGCFCYFWLHTAFVDRHLQEQAHATRRASTRRSLGRMPSIWSGPAARAAAASSDADANLTSGGAGQIKVFELTRDNIDNGHHKPNKKVLSSRFGIEVALAGTDDGHSLPLYQPKQWTGRPTTSKGGSSRSGGGGEGVQVCEQVSS